MPVIAAAVMAPMASASRNVPCAPTQIPQGNGTGTSGWVTSLGSNPNAAPAAWVASATPSPSVGTPFFRAYTDSALPANGSTTVTSTAQLSVIAGMRYEIQFNVQAGKGYNGAGPGVTCTTFNSTAIFDVGSGTSRQVLFRGHTQTPADVNPSVFMDPPANCTTTGSGARVNAPGYNGIAGAVYSTTQTYVATTTGDVELRMRFVMATGTNSGNNDDWFVKPTLVSCSRSGA